MLRRIAALTVLLVLTGCSGATKAPKPAEQASNAGQPTGSSYHPLTLEERKQLHRNFAHVVPPQVYALLGGIAAPSATSGSRSASVLLPYTLTGGQVYNAGDAGVIGSGNADTSNPAVASLAPTGANFPDNFAYVIFRVDDVNQFARTVEVDASGSGNFGFAAYDWGYGALGRWAPLYYGPAGSNIQGTLETTGVNFRKLGTEDMAIVVFCLDPATIDVVDVTVTDVTMNLAPFADIQSAPSFGTAPLSVLLDAGASTDDDGTIEKYRFDPLADGNWIDNGTDPTMPYTYNTPGPFFPRVEVTDDFGYSAIAQEALMVSKAVYDEVEDNDGFGQANQLPGIPFSMFNGNIGFDGTYDGDTGDLFLLNAGLGDQIAYQLLYSDADSTNVALWLYDGFGSQIAEATGDRPRLQYEVGSADELPLYLAVLSFNGASDYYLSGNDVKYWEFEDNDEAFLGNFISELNEGDHAFANYGGSLGTNDADYRGYDGDFVDWYGFDIGLEAQFDFSLTYNSGTGNIGVSLYDGEGDLLASSATGSGIETLSYESKSGDVPNFFLYVACTSGHSDYKFSGTTVYDGSAYDEVENNDDINFFSDANALPDSDFADFRGNSGDPFGTYDNDEYDNFSFNAAPGEQLKFTVEWPVGGGLTGILRQSNNQYVESPYSVSPQSFELYLMAFEYHTTPYILQVQGQGPATDYTITRESMSGFDEVENNDSQGEANSLPAFPFPFYRGSVGSGGSNHDGDNADWFTFNATAGQHPQLVITYETAHLNSFPPSITVYDSEGDEIGQSNINAGSTMWYVVDGLTANDVGPFYVEIAIDVASYADYYLGGSNF